MDIKNTGITSPGDLTNTIDYGLNAEDVHRIIDLWKDKTFEYQRSKQTVLLLRTRPAVRKCVKGSNVTTLAPSFRRLRRDFSFWVTERMMSVNGSMIQSKQNIVY